MKERERIVGTGLTGLLVLLWLGFLVHRSPRFAGSGWGGVLAVTGAALMLVPLLYSAIKRIGLLKRLVTRVVSMRTLLAWHIYAGLLGPILVLLHTGHKFESPLGIALTALTLVVVLSGAVGRYLMSHVSRELREKKKMLADLEQAHARAASALATRPAEAAVLHRFSGVAGRLVLGLLAPEGGAVSVATGRPTTHAAVVRLSEAVADVEYAIRTHEVFKAWFSRWLKFHIIISVGLYVLLALHIWAAIHYGLRWFS